MGKQKRMDRGYKPMGPVARKLLICCIVVMALLTVASLVLLRLQVMQFDENKDAEVSYSMHYGFIASDNSDPFLLAVYTAAKETAATKGIYVELLGENLTGNYSSRELMEMAIAAKMDGIILESDETVQMKNLIDKAVSEGIPVVTYMTDSSDSKRQSYVGVSYYNLGKQYGEEVLKTNHTGECEVLILTKENRADSSRNNVYSGVLDVLAEDETKPPLETEEKTDYSVEITAIDTSSTFSVEEAVREILLDEENTTNIVICLDEITTNCVYQALVDYNMVGQIDVIGYYDSESILQGIDKGIIWGTVTVDASKMGESCIDALTEYQESGYVSNYLLVEIETITKANVKDYLKLNEGE